MNLSWYKTAKTKMTRQEMKALRSLVQKITQGKRDWDENELQLQMNFPEIIEKMLRDEYNELV